MQGSKCTHRPLGDPGDRQVVQPGEQHSRPALCGQCCLELDSVQTTWAQGQCPSSGLLCSNTLATLKMPAVSQSAQVGALCQVWEAEGPEKTQC